MLTLNNSEVTLVTPPSNTGVKLPEPCKVSITAGIDWVSCTFPRASLQEVLRLIESYFNQTFVQQKTGWKFYSESYRTPDGVLLADKRLDGEAVASEAYLSIPASCLNSLEPAQQGLLFGALHELGARCSRLDSRIDDYGKTVTVEKAVAAATAGNIAHFKMFRYIESGSVGCSQTGRTVEFGRRGKGGSGKFLRIYDKEFESCGRIPATRIELELSGRRSANCFQFLAQTPPELWPELIGGWIKDAIAFVDRTVSDKLHRCPLLQWWSELIDRFSELSLSVERPKSSLQRVKTWIEKQVAPSVALMLHAMRGDSQFDVWFYELLSQGERRLNAMHKSMLCSELMLT